MTIKIFYSYAHEDERLLNELKKHLKIFKRQGKVEDWHDRRIAAGTEWARDIYEHLSTADIILLLISADFLNSDYCYDKELEVAMQLHEAGETRVIPVMLRSVLLEKEPFGKLQALPDDARPVESWENLDEAFTNVTKGIARTIFEIRKSKLDKIDRQMVDVRQMVESSKNQDATQQAENSARSDLYEKLKKLQQELSKDLEAMSSILNGVSTSAMDAIRSIR